MQPVRVSYNNAEDDREEDGSSSDYRIKLDEADNAFGDCQNNNDDSDEDEDGNSGNDTIFVDNLVWEDIGYYLVTPYILDHYCGLHVFKEGAEKLFQKNLECIMLTSDVLLEYFIRVIVQSNKFAWLRSVLDKFGGIKWKNITVQ